MEINYFKGILEKEIGNNASLRKSNKIKKEQQMPQYKSKI